MVCYECGSRRTTAYLLNRSSCWALLVRTFCCTTARINSSNTYYCNSHYNHAHSTNTSFAFLHWIRPSLSSVSRMMTRQDRRSMTITSKIRHQTINQERTWTNAFQTRLFTVTSSASLLGGEFEPTAPPGTHGTPVFSDIQLDFSNVAAITLPSAQRNQDPAAVFVVTGASRGIGLQCVKSLYERTKGTVIACCRIPDQATSLQSFIDSIPDPNRIQVVALDIESQSSIESAAADIAQRSQGRVDMLMNVAGILGDGITTPGPERALERIDRGWFEKTLAVNLIGPVMLSQAVTPLMMHRVTHKQNETASDGRTVRARPVAIIANISARVGSISDNRLGGWYSYRISKSALNQATRTMALELKRHRVWCIALHPGTTQTDLSKPFQGNVRPDKLFPVDFTVSRLLSVIDAMTEQHSGGFFDWAGKAISF